MIAKQEEVEILREEEISIVRGQQTIPVMAVTYQAAGYPPRTVFIDKAKYDEKALREAIKADLEQVKAVKPRKITL